MNCTIEEKDGYSFLNIEGRMDLAASLLLEKKLSELVKGGNKRLFVSLANVEYLSSAGLRFLLHAAGQYQSMSGFFAIIKVQRNILEIVRVGGFEKMLPIFPNEQEALQHS